MLAKNKALERLALGDAELGDAGVTSICAGLATNTALQEIELDYKGLTAVGAAALAGMRVSGVWVYRNMRKSCPCQYNEEGSDKDTIHTYTYTAYSEQCIP